MELWIAGAIALMNMVAFFAQGVDKWRAGRGGARTSEKTLLLLALPLATPGAWLGMRVFHQKTAKKSFRWKMIFVTVLNVLTVAGAIYAIGRWDIV